MTKRALLAAFVVTWLSVVYSDFIYYALEGHTFKSAQKKCNATESFRELLVILTGQMTEEQIEKELQYKYWSRMDNETGKEICYVIDLALKPRSSKVHDCEDTKVKAACRRYVDPSHAKGAASISLANVEHLVIPCLFAITARIAAECT